MARHIQDIQFQSEEFPGRSRLYQEIRFHRFDLELESDTAKEFRVRDHLDGLRMTAELATEAPFDFRHVRNVIEMAVGEQEQPGNNPFRHEPIARTIRRVEENGPLGSLHEITVRLENPAAKSLVSHGAM